jgi:hypothetical protein
MTPPPYDAAGAVRARAESTSAGDEAMIRDYGALQRALRDEYARPAPDLSRTRALKSAIAALRVKIAIAQGEPPPHTD